MNYLSGAFVNSEPNDDDILSMSPLPPPLLLAETEGAADSDATFCLNHASPSFFSGSAGGAANMEEKGEPILDMTELQKRKSGTQNYVEEEGGRRDDEKEAYPTDDMRDGSGRAGAGVAETDSGALGGGGVRKSGFAPLASIGGLDVGAKESGRTTLSPAVPVFASPGAGTRRLLR